MAAEWVVVLEVAYVVFSLLSLVGSVFIVTTYTMHKSVRSSSGLGLVFYMALCDVAYVLKFGVTSIAGLAGSTAVRTTGTWQCNALGFVGQWAALASVSWNFCIALNVYFTIRWPFTYKLDKAMPWYHAFAWSMATISAIIPAALNEFGISGDGTCWIKGGSNPLRFLFFGPLFLYIAVSFFVLVTRVFCWEAAHTAERKVHRAVVRRLALFVGVFVVCWTWQIVARAWEATGSPEPPWLTLMESAFNGGLGCWNACVWGAIVYRKVVGDKSKSHLPHHKRAHSHSTSGIALKADGPTDHFEYQAMRE